MASDVIVAVFDNAERAAEAVRELQGAGVASSAIHQFDRRHPAWTDETTTTSSGGHQGGFWSWLFGNDEGTEADHRVYEDTVTRGGTVVSVTAPQADHARLIEILERFDPVDLDAHDRAGAAAMGERTKADMAQTTATTTATASARGAAPAPGVAATDRTTYRMDTRERAGEERVIPLAEEQLQVGKRMVETGRTRIRRYVVETPVEERVRLRTERVIIERRRPVSGDTVSPDAFTETTADITERAETPVVSKVAHVGEEVVVRTESGEREETVRDKVRRDQVEVVKDGEKEGVRGNATTRPERSSGV